MTEDLLIMVERAMALYAMVFHLHGEITDNDTLQLKWIIEIKKPDELQTLPSFNYQRLSFPDDPNMVTYCASSSVTSGLKPGVALMLLGALSQQ